MPNGADKNWVRTCLTIDGFITRYGHPPAQVAMNPDLFTDLVAHVLSPAGYALICSKYALVPDDVDGLEARDDKGNVFVYGIEPTTPNRGGISTRDWYGEAVLRDDLGGW